MMVNQAIGNKRKREKRGSKLNQKSPGREESLEQTTGRVYQRKKGGRRLVEAR